MTKKTRFFVFLFFPVFWLVSFVFCSFFHIHSCSREGCSDLIGRFGRLSRGQGERERKERRGRERK